MADPDVLKQMRAANEAVRSSPSGAWFEQRVQDGLLRADGSVRHDYSPGQSPLSEIDWFEDRVIINVCERSGHLTNFLCRLPAFGILSASERSLTRRDLINDIEAGKVVVTATFNEGENRYTKGSAVHVVSVDGAKYLRTDGNTEAADNLGTLPLYRPW